MFDYEVRYKINNMVILKILRDYSQKQSDLNILEYTDIKLYVNFRPWNETIQILDGELILTNCGNSLPFNIVDSIEHYCTEIKKNNITRPENKIEIGSKSDEEIRDKISAYNEVAKESFDCEYREAIASIHMLRWVLNEENDATGDEVENEKMNKPNIRVYECSNAGKFECCGACRFTDSHTTTIGCECDLYVGELVRIME